MPLTRLVPMLGAMALGLLLAPKLKMHRVSAALFGALMVLAFDAPLFVAVGRSPWRWLLVLPPAVLWLYPWYYLPWRMSRSIVPEGSAALEPYDPARHPLPEPRRAWLEAARAQLEGAGFTCIDDVVLAGASSQPAPRLVMLDHTAEGTRATLHVEPAGFGETTDFVSYATVLADGRWVAASNQAGARILPPLAEVVGATLPEVRDPGEVLAVFRALVRETAGVQPRSLPPGTDARSQAEVLGRRHTAQMLARGWYRRTPKGLAFSPRAALYTGLRDFFPLRQLLARRARNEQDHVLRRLGFTFPPREHWIWDYSPGWWLSYAGVQAVGAIALLAFGAAWPWLAALLAG